MQETSSLPAFVRPTGRFMLAHPAHALALGLGSGLSPKAPGTVGTLWAWAAYLVLQPWMNEARWGLLLLLGLLTVVRTADMPESALLCQAS